MTTQRDLLDREIGTPPPSTIDIDRLIARQRRRGHLRTTGLSGLVTALVLVVGAVLVLLPRAGDLERDRNVGASPSPSVSSSVSLSPRAAEAARLTEVLRQWFTQAFPGATLSRAPSSTGGAAPAEPLVFADFGTHFAAAAVVTDTAGTGTLTVAVGKEDTQFRTDSDCMSDPPPLDVKYSCEVVPAPGGGNILRASSEIGDDNYLRLYVEIIRADGNAVSIEVSNGVMDTNDPYHGQRPQPLLTLDQATVLVQEPSLATTLT
jgi:hypothetical protein